MRLFGTMILAGTTLLAACACDRVAEPIGADPHPLTGPATATTTPSRCTKRWGNKPQREPFVAGFVAPDCPAKEINDELTPPAPKDPLRTGTISFPDAAGTPSLTAEIADSPTTRQRGLMLRRNMPENRGMIFVFGQERSDHQFWMHNTCIPLDMMFIDTDGYIVGIQENVPTMNDDTYSVGCQSAYVLEVNAGWSRKHGVAPGQRAKFDGI
ncbi:MAG: DUF192 domain-containing protein [Polyangiaceae bacterium]